MDKAREYYRRFYEYWKDGDMDRERVSLSLKATQEDPWQHFARTHQIGQIVPGKVTKLVPFGSFVRVEEGIEGLVHISELAERHIELPEQIVQASSLQGTPCVLAPRNQHD